MPSHRSSELLNRQASPRGSNAQTLLDFTLIARPNWNEVHVRAKLFKLPTRSQPDSQLHSYSWSIQIGKRNY